MADWESVTVTLVDTQRSRQTSIQEWREKKEKLTNFIPEGMKDLKPVPKTSQRRRMKGKRTKKEQMVMKKTHRDKGWLLAPPPTPEIMNHERVIEREVEIVDGEKDGEDEVKNSRVKSKACMQRCHDGPDRGSSDGVRLETAGLPGHGVGGGGGYHAGV